MADKMNKNPHNIAGKYYVDIDCVGCGQCCDIAPDYFAEDKTDNIVYVKLQPTNDEGMALCEEAVANCPVEAIGNDG
jgi:ferredoxin